MIELLLNFVTTLVLVQRVRVLLFFSSGRFLWKRKWSIHLAILFARFTPQARGVFSLNENNTIYVIQVIQVIIWIFTF